MRLDRDQEPFATGWIWWGVPWTLATPWAGAACAGGARRTGSMPGAMWLVLRFKEVILQLHPRGESLDGSGLPRLRSTASALRRSKGAWDLGSPTWSSEGTTVRHTKQRKAETTEQFARREEKPKICMNSILRRPWRNLASAPPPLLRLRTTECKTGGLAPLWPSTPLIHKRGIGGIKGKMLQLLESSLNKSLCICVATLTDYRRVER